MPIPPPLCRASPPRFLPPIKAAATSKGGSEGLRALLGRCFTTTKALTTKAPPSRGAAGSGVSSHAGCCTGPELLRGAGRKKAAFFWGFRGFLGAGSSRCRRSRDGVRAQPVPRCKPQGSAGARQGGGKTRNLGVIYNPSALELLPLGSAGVGRCRGWGDQCTPKAGGNRWFPSIDGALEGAPGSSAAPRFVPA